MSKVTLKILFDELQNIDAKIQKMDAKIQKIDAKGDVRFEFVKEQIQSNYTDLKTELSHARKDISIIREQTAHITERVTTIEKSTTKSSNI